MTSRAIPWIGRRSARREAVAAGQAPRILPLLFFVFVVIAVFFLMIFLRIALDETAFELETVQRQIEEAESRQLDLRLELAELQDPLRIANEATRMGLTYPAQRVAVSVDPNGQGTNDLAPPSIDPKTQALETGQP